MPPKPTTCQRDLAKLPKALAPLVARPQWATWRWTLQKDRWQKPPFMATAPERHASTKDPSTWSDYATALTTVQAGKADGITYILTGTDPFAAIDLDHCRHDRTSSIDVWAQNFLQAAIHTYSEVTPSGEGIRIWGLTSGDSGPINRKFDLEIDGKPIAAELFRRAPKALTITGYTLDRAVRELGSIDRMLQWAVIWGERRKAAAAEAAAKAATEAGAGCNSFNGSGTGHDVDWIEQVVREGAPDGRNRSDTFHVVVGHYLGCGWSADRVHEHLAQFPRGIADKYIGEGRLRREINRSAEAHAARELPLATGWTAPLESSPVEAEPAAPAPEPDPEIPAPGIAPPEPDDVDRDPELEEEDDPPEADEGAPPQPDPKLPKMYAHGDPDPRPLRSWLIKYLLATVAHGLLSGQWGTGKTFVAFDLAAAAMTGQPFLGHPIKRQCGVMFIAAEGASEVRLRFEAVIREKCGGMQRAPFRWYETTPLLLQKNAAQTLIAMARQADASLQAEFGLPLGLIIIDTVAASAGYPQPGAESDAATGVAVMGALKTIAQTCSCFVLGVDHFGKNVEAGTRGTGAKEDAADIVWACLGERQLSGGVSNTRLAIRKHRGGRAGQTFPFTLREVKAPELDEDGEPITTMVVDWGSAGTSVGGTGPESDRWVEGVRQDQRAGILRLKRVLMEALADRGIDLPVPPHGVAARMIDQEIVRKEFYSRTPAEGTPKQKRQIRSLQFKRALDRAEEDQLIGILEIDNVTYLRLTRPDPEESVDA